MSDVIPPAMAQQIVDVAQKDAAAIMSAPPGTEPSWAKPAVSIVYLFVFLALIIVAYAMKDSTSLALLSGVGASMAQQVAGYYLGSSAGSARKTELSAGKP